ncbi:hypothetical protein [Robertmurraya siralis]|nr:hypothetical protein [Robertmurraya siralis]
MNFAEVAFQLSGFLFIATICVIMFIGARIIRKKVPLFRKNRSFW